ncbi:MAG TPA: Xaa-Pro peptidase family protein [Rectinemataceae bacterium]|nr:Xaa-Pro peptidase family protein [Rectinemataceae bacterium]
MHDYAARCAKVAAKLREEGLAACMFRDTEGALDTSVRYLTGQPGDGILVVSAEGRAVLAAWDFNMAKSLATADEILPYTDFKRMPTLALAGILSRLGVPKGSRVELPAATSYPHYADYVETLVDYDLVCRHGGMAEFVSNMRAVKDATELGIYRRAAKITDDLVDAIESAVRSGAIATELDAGLFIERECRLRGCEGTGFETLAAGPSRSFGIHAFPPFGAGPFATKGLSILDFGLRFEGYTTDVTMGFARGPLDAKAERMVELVIRAHAECISMVAPGVASRDIALRADAIFAEAGMVMPHGLGHGVGLEAHEAPAVRNREDNRDILEPGHIITIEPGLYDPELGGIRLEDDVLVTASGHEVLTRSRIVRL